MATQQEEPVMIQQEPNVMSRLDRLDIMLGYLEEIRASHISVSGPSTPSSGTATTDGGNDSSFASSPKSQSLEKRCRPIDAVIMETQLKGSLVDRLDQLENRVLKLGLQLEEEIEEEKKKEDEEKHEKGKKSPAKGLKRLVKSCVEGGKHKNKKH